MQPMDVTGLAQGGFVSVSYPPALRVVVDEAMESWRAFCALAPEYKMMLAGGDRMRDFGYMMRQDKGPTADRKELFHASLKRMDALQSQARHIKDKRAIQFMHATHALLERMAYLIQAFAQGVEKEYRLPGFVNEVISTQRNWVFRYLHYSGGEMLAHPHTDRGGFTFHLHETDAGGEYLGFDGAWHPWPVSEEKTIIFPSMGLQFRSCGKLKALCHRVVPTQETRSGGRYSMVAFIDFAMDYRYNDAAKRLQDFDPGFNYRMPRREFDGLFVPAESQRV